MSLHKTKDQWTLYWFFRFSQIDGGHHKAWVIDQATRILHDTQVIQSVRIWKMSDGSIHRVLDVHLANPSNEYLQFIKDYKYDPVEQEYYNWDVGIAP